MPDFQPNYQFFREFGGETPSGKVAQFPWFWRTFPGEDGYSDGKAKTKVTNPYRPVRTLRPNQGGLWHAQEANASGGNNWDRLPTLWPNAVGDRDALLYDGCYHRHQFGQEAVNFTSGDLFAGSETDGLTVVAIVVPFSSRVEHQGKANVLANWGGNGSQFEIGIHRDEVAVRLSTTDGSVDFGESLTYSDIQIPEPLLCYVQIGLGSSSKVTVEGKGEKALPNGPSAFDTSLFDYDDNRLPSTGPTTIGMHAKTNNENQQAYSGYICELGVIPRLLTSDEEDTLETYFQNEWKSKSVDTSPFGVRADLCRDSMDPRQSGFRQGNQDSYEIDDGHLIDNDPKPLSIHHDPIRSLHPKNYNNLPIYRASGLNSLPSIEFTTQQDTGQWTYSTNGFGWDQISFTGNGVVIGAVCNPADGSANNLNPNGAWIVNYYPATLDGWQFQDSFGLSVGFDGTDTYLQFMTPSGSRGGARQQYQTTYSGIVLVTAVADFASGRQYLRFNGNEVLSDPITLTKIESDANASETDTAFELGGSKLTWFRQSNINGTYEARHFAGQMGPSYLMDGLMDPTLLEGALIEAYNLPF